jgi:hydrogenase-1 operon protein HyaF
MMTFPLPVVAYRPVPNIGPGSQPAEDEVLQTLDVPSDVHTFRPPVTDLDAPPEVVAASLDFLRELLAALRATPYGAARPVRFSLFGYPPAVRAEINELLGEGEVSVQGGDDLRAQETAFTGLWRIRGAGIDAVEASAFPSDLLQCALSRRAPETGTAVPPEHLMNAPAIHSEIVALSAQWTPGREAHVINLSLLPVTPDDLAWLDAQLGRAGFSILSRGFGNCRITATALPHVWWVQYFNGMEKLILNSLEVVDIPAVALAAAEDYAATIERLDEWIVSLESA